MKRNLSIRLSVLAVLMVLVSSCTKKAEYTNAIPADASVVAIHLKSLADKAGIGDKDNREAIQKLTDALKSGMDAATYRQLEAVLKDPSKSGIDIAAPIYLFTAPSISGEGIVMKVNDEDNLRSFIGMMEKERLSSAIEEGEGYSYTRINQEGLLVFDASTLLITSYDSDSQQEAIQKTVAALLKQTPENSLSSKPAFRKMQQQGGDIDFLVSPSSAYGAYFKQMNYAMPQDTAWKDFSFIGNLSFEKGKIALDAEIYTDNPELKAMLEKQVDSTRPIGNAFLKYFPQSTLALFSMGIDGEKFYNALQQNEWFRQNLSAANASDLKEVFSTFNDDITAGLINVSMDKMPTFLIYANVKNGNALKELYGRKAEIDRSLGSELVKLGEDEYALKSRQTNVFFGVRDQVMYVTNDELLYKSICQPLDPSAKDTEYASTLKGKRSAFVVNADAILELPAVKMLAEYGGPEFQMYYALIGKMSYLEVTSDGGKSNVTLQLKDRDTNALKQILAFARQYSGM